MASILFCQPVNKHEVIGTIMIIVAAIFMMGDPYAKRIGEEANVVADLISITASIPFALYFKFTAMLVKDLSMYKILFYQINLSTIMYSLFAVKFDGADFTTTENGIFGFMCTGDLLSNIFLYSFMTGFMGSYGYILATKYFHPVVVMNSFLIEPFIG